MRSEEIRQQFIDFFLTRGHQHVRGTPLVLADDPTLLFTNAGMNQFKPIFLNLEIPTYTRAVNSQRCMRVSGKHNDLDEVGFSPHHHTLFEMLGNWSFGDYYKKEAITWAWELLTEKWGLPKSKLWASVFRDDLNEIPADEEAAAIWANETDVPKEHIVFFGRKENFWEMGETGPCGPCTEIHIDRGPEFCNLMDRPHRCSVNGDCRRYIEIWNLVFIQYNRKTETELVLLPKQHVDTGMGLERITSIIQGVRSNYDSDLFAPILDSIYNLAGISIQAAESNPFPFRVIADHVRAATCLIADGVVPSNEWRGYVLRRIIRRAMRFGKKIGFNRPFLHEVSESVVKKLGTVYPELIHGKSMVNQVIKHEEERFFKTLNQAMPAVEDLIQKTVQSGSGKLNGKEVFRLYDTFGFPVDLIQDIAVESGLSIDLDGYQGAMNEQKTRARASTKGFETSESGPYEALVQNLPSTQFIGYEATTAETRILAVLNAGKTVDSCSKGMLVDVMINPSPFYMESGGQVGDSGVLRSGSGLLSVRSAKKIGTNYGLLQGEVVEGGFRVGETVTAEVDRMHRHAVARNHTATHLLHAALRACLGDHVKQSGSLVSPDRLRFDFTHFAPLDPVEIASIEEQVNRMILENFVVSASETDLEQALDQGVTALFGEKYGDRVRVIRISEVSAELCGGTHVFSTGSIGLFKILSESSIASGIRRIEAVTGFRSIDWVNHKLHTLAECATLMKCDEDSMPDRIDRLQKQARQLTKELDELKTRDAKHQLLSPDAIRKTPGGTAYLIREALGLQPNQLRGLADEMKDKLGNGVVVLGTASQDKANLLVAVTRDLTAKFNAVSIIQKIAPLVNGSGGGRPDMAQAGGTAVNGLKEALETAESFLKEMDP